VGVSADVALPQAEIQWRDSQVPALQLQQLHGRLQADWQEQAWRLSGQNFSFVQVDGQHWPSSNWEVRTSGPAAQPRTQVSLDYADIAMAAQVVQALPVPAEVLAPLQRWKPEGAVRQLQLEWASPTDYQARGRVSGLVVQPQPAEHGTGLPGVEGLNATFELDERGGKASLDLQSGVLHFPGVFEEPAIPMDTLQAQVRWRVDRGHLRLDVPTLRFANADAQGQAQGSWRMGETPEDRLPGYLQLTGELERPTARACTATCRWRCRSWRATMCATACARARAARCSSRCAATCTTCRSSSRAAGASTSRRRCATWSTTSPRSGCWGLATFRGRCCRT